MPASRKKRGDITLYRPPGPVLRDYLRSSAEIRCVQGPIESGKSTASAMALWKAVATIPRWRDGKRRSRWLVTRSTYPELRGSTIETFLYWFPPEVYATPGGGKFYDTEPYLYEMRVADIEADFIFESFPDDKEETIRSLRSKEYTGAWINECQYTPQRLYFEIASRTGRYPPIQEMPEGYHRGQWVVSDMNAPPTDDHWVLRMRGDVALPLEMAEAERRKFAKPANMEFFKQPSALVEQFDNDGTIKGYKTNPEAENLENMDADRYMALIGGRSKAEIDRDLMGRVVPIVRGEPVFPGARRELHIGGADLEPMPGADVYIGLDFGRTPAAVLGQNIAGRWIIFDEEVAWNMGATAFAPRVALKLQQLFPGSSYHAWGDPSGDWKGQSNDRTPFQIFAAAGILVRPPALKDNPEKRISATESVLSTLQDGKPRLLLHPRCKRLCDAIFGGYVYNTMSAADGTRVIKEPNKNQHSHVAEALQYLLWGGGEVRDVLRPATTRKAVTSATPKKRKLFSFQRKGRR